MWIVGTLAPGDSRGRRWRQRRDTEQLAGSLELPEGMQFFQITLRVSCTVPGVTGSMSGVIKHGSVTTNKKTHTFGTFPSCQHFWSYSTGIIWIILFSPDRNPPHPLPQKNTQSPSGCFYITLWKDEHQHDEKKNKQQGNTSNIEYYWTWLF